MLENLTSGISVCLHFFQLQEWVFIISENTDHSEQEVWSKIFNAIWQGVKKNCAIFGFPQNVIKSQAWEALHLFCVGWKKPKIS